MFDRFYSESQFYRLGTPYPQVRSLAALDQYNAALNQPIVKEARKNFNLKKILKFIREQRC